MRTPMENDPQPNRQSSPGDPEALQPDAILGRTSPTPPPAEPESAVGGPATPEPLQIAVRPSTSRLTWLMLLLGGMVFLVALPQIAEHIEYGLTRGKARAEAEAARELLEQYPEAVNRVRYAVEAVEPSVVGIQTSRSVARRRYYDEAALAPAEAGSGVIVDKAGYIVTNLHVVARADAVAVRLSDGRVFHNVQVVGVDRGNDLAVLRIEALGLIEAPWGDSDQLKVGDTVLAIGNPFELAQTVTAGIVSAKERRGITSKGIYQEFLQHDAAVNPGNSGGPLVNLKGEIVGINTAIIGEAYQGISFAIPSSIARKVCEQLRSGQQVVRGWLGVEMQAVTETLAKRFGLEWARGVLVVAVQQGSPAEKAGLQPGDVILQWNGKRINNSVDLRLLVAGTEVGSEVAVGVFRDGKSLELKVKVGHQPPQLEP
jgi:serine protease Do